MQRGIEKLLPSEADHLQGILLQHGKEHNIPVSVLEIIYMNVVETDSHKNTKTPLNSLT